MTGLAVVTCTSVAIAPLAIIPLIANIAANINFRISNSRSKLTV
jgi:hypothetical protein